MSHDWGVGRPREQHGRPRRRRASRGGFTLAELALATTILLVALMSISAATLRSHSLRRQNRQRVIAANAVRTYSEQIHAASIQASKNLTTWAETVLEEWGAGGTVGTTFDVVGLTPAGANESVGTIEIITDETATDDELGVQLGMPRDLDGDGAADDVDVSATARLLPVIVRVRWVSHTGVNEIRHPFYVMGY